MEEGREYFAHETACVDQPCHIGQGTMVWHFSHIMPEAHIGRNCRLGQNVYIDRGVQVGDGCKIQNNVSVYKGVTLEDEVFCGPSMVFTNVVTPRAFINRMDQFSHTLVQRGATLGANSTVVCGATIGAYAFVGAGAVVTRDVPPYALIYGVPAYQAGWVCRCGVPLPTAEPLVCAECGARYRLDGKGQLQPGG